MIFDRSMNAPVCGVETWEEGKTVQGTRRYDVLTLLRWRSSLVLQEKPSVGSS